MNKLSLLMEGKKTYLGIIVIALGYFGVGQYIAPDELSATFDSIMQIAGMAITAYGRYKAK